MEPLQERILDSFSVVHAYGYPLLVISFTWALEGDDRDLAQQPLLNLLEELGLADSTVIAEHM